MDVKVQVSNYASAGSASSGVWPLSGGERPQMISQTAEYALRVVVCLAYGDDTPLTTARVAEVTRVPAGYLCKVLRALGRAGLVVSQSGLHGGFTLGRPAEKISVLNVVNAMGGVRRIRECPLGFGVARPRPLPPSPPTRQGGGHLGADICRVHNRRIACGALQGQTSL